MKSFSKVLSVLVLSLFCSFFVGMEVNADTAGAQTVTLPDKTLTYTASDVFFNYTGTNMSATTLTNRDVGISFMLLTIPDTVVGQEYTVSVRLKNLRSSPSSGITIYDPQFLSFGINGTFSESSMVSDDKVSVSDSGVIEFKIDALDGNTPVWLFYSTLIGNTSHVSARASFSYPAISSGMLGFSTNSYLISADASSISYTLQVGGDDLLDEMMHQTDVIQNEMDKVNGSLTTFPGSGDMDASKGQLDTAISDYDQIEGSLFDSGQAAFDQFDPSSVLTFSSGIYASIAYISQLMVSIISAMGEFSIIYTVGVVLVFFGMLIGLWRFFK